MSIGGYESCTLVIIIRARKVSKERFRLKAREFRKDWLMEFKQDFIVEVLFEAVLKDERDNVIKL